MIALACFFTGLEYLDPSRRIDRKSSFSKDMLALAVFFAGGGVSDVIIQTALSGLDWSASFSNLPGAIKIVLSLILIDFGLYWIHRAMHRFSWMWKTHRWHHSIEHLYWFSGLRTSLPHSFLFAIPQIFVPLVIFRLSPLQVGIAVSFGVFIQFWGHANTRASLGPLDSLIVSPRYHLLHHSIEERFQKCNFSIVLTIWDRLFGTYTSPDKAPGDFRLGLQGAPSSLQMIIGF